jgi:tetrahydromethanopterin S-methyltransferase subunit B
MTEINITANFNLEEIAQEVAPYISPSVIANEMDIDAIADCIDIYGITDTVIDSVSEHLDYGDIHINYRDLAAFVDTNELADLLRDGNEDLVGGQNEVLVSRVAQLEMQVTDLQRTVEMMVNAMRTASNLMGFNTSGLPQRPSIRTMSELYGNTEPF